MARSRNIKPGFFLNDELGELPALTRLLFAGLWVIADREGRLEDRPKKIKAEILPYDQIDADEMLQVLDAKGFIKRYQVGKANLIQVLTWKKHQNPHVKEAPSILPEYVENQTSTVQEQCSGQPSPERAGLIPDSLLLIPDSLSSDSLKEKAPRKRSEKAVAFIPPDWINPTHWATWHSCAKRKKATDEQKQMAVDKLDAWRKSGQDYATALENAALGGYQGLFLPDKPNEKVQGNRKPMETFAERDAANGRKRWEEMTGQQHPDNTQNNILNVFDSQILELTHA